MPPPLPIFVGDELLLKKAHPCGANHWLVLRTGADLKLECAGCHHQVWLPRAQVERRVKRFLARGPRAAALAAAAAQTAAAAEAQAQARPAGGEPARPEAPRSDDRR